MLDAIPSGHKREKEIALRYTAGHVFESVKKLQAICRLTSGEEDSDVAKNAKDARRHALAALEILTQKLEAYDPLLERATKAVVPGKSIPIEESIWASIAEPNELMLYVLLHKAHALAQAVDESRGTDLAEHVNQTRARVYMEVQGTTGRE